MQIKVTLNDNPIFYQNLYLNEREVLQAYKELPPGYQVKFICDLIKYANEESYYMVRNLTVDWAGHSKETSEKSIDLLKRLIEEYEHYKGEQNEKSRQIR